MAEHIPDPLLTEDEKLDIKRDIIRYANKNKLQYRDHGSWVSLLLPIYSAERIEKGALDVKTRFNKDDRPKKSSRRDRK